MEEKSTEKRRLPFFNFRILTVCALALVFGIFLMARIRFGGLRPSDFVFFLVFFLLMLFPLSWRRAGAVFAALLIFGGLGAGVMEIRIEQYLGGPEAGTYFITGTVVSATPQTGGVDVLLDDVAFDGASSGGKLSVHIDSEQVRVGDILAFESFMTRNGIPMSENSYSEYLFANDIRYRVSHAEYKRAGGSRNFLLHLDAALFDRLEEDMGGPEAQVAYALLTGNSRGMDEGLLTEVRKGGIAHIFAVSGLHIGILFGAVMLLARPLKRYAVVPAIGVCILYAAFCAFTVSSVRAVIMCSCVGLYRTFGRKYDFLQSISLAALIVLLFSPGDLLSAGFRLSFGACVGLGLFSGTLGRLLGRIPKMPRAAARYLSANLSVQLFTFPILLDCFGYFSVWGFVLNLVLIPLLPVLFLTTLLFSLFALIIPPAGAFFLAVPKGLLSLFLLAIAGGDFTFILTGFSLGMGLVVWLVGCVLLSERFRIRPTFRGLLAGLLAAAFVLFVVAENVVFTGGRIAVYTSDRGSAALVRTPSANVLVIDGGISIEDCEDFLSRKYGGELDAVFVLSDDELAGINHAVFLDTEIVYARDEVATGLRESPVRFAETVELGGIEFRFLTREKLAISAEGVAIEVDFANAEALGADLFLDSSDGGLQYSFGHGIIKRL